MAEIKVTLIHPTDNSELEVQFDDNLTANAVIEELINAQFLSPLGSGICKYRFVSKKNDVEFRGEQTFGQAGVKENDTVRIIVW